MARSVRAALTALHRCGVPFRAPWKPPSDLRECEGPFTGEEKRPPQHPLVREKQREACRRWREKRRAAGLNVRSEPTERRRAQTREATRRWRERKRVSALRATAAQEPRRLAKRRRPDERPRARRRAVARLAGHESSRSASSARASLRSLIASQPDQAGCTKDSRLICLVRRAKIGQLMKSFGMAFSPDFLREFQSGVLSWRYRGIPCLKCPISQSTPG